MAAQANAAIHVALERHPDALVRDAALVEHVDGGLHHPFRAADEGNSPVARAHDPVDYLGHDADAAEPFWAGAVDGLRDINDAAARELVELVNVQAIGRSPRSV